MEKTLRVLGGGGEDGHSHSHSHSHSHTEEKQGGGETEGNATGVAAGSANGLRERKKVDGKDSNGEEEGEEKHAQVSKLSAYLNLFGDFCHNMCVVFFSLCGVVYFPIQVAHSPIFICAERTVSRMFFPLIFRLSAFTHRQ